MCKYIENGKKSFFSELTSWFKIHSDLLENRVINTEDIEDYLFG